MPYIHTKTNIEITKEQEEKLKKELGRAIELIPGKTENWLMLCFEGQCSMYFNGSKEFPMAFVEVKIFGKASSENYKALTAEITRILKAELGISGEHIYIKYEEVKEWGFNGSNF